MEGMKNAYVIWTGNTKGRAHLGNLGVIERVLLKWILKE
jgi:hypothetical protein